MSLLADEPEPKYMLAGMYFEAINIKRNIPARAASLENYTVSLILNVHKVKMPALLTQYIFSENYTLFK